MKSKLLRSTLCVATILLALPFQSGCMQLNIIDVSHAEIYSAEIGKRFLIQGSIIVRGVKWNRRATDQPDYFVVMSSNPRASGPEYFAIQDIPAGTTFRIVGVVTRTSKLFPATEYTIAFENFSVMGLKGQQVRLSEVSGFRLYEKQKSSGRVPRLSAEYFRELPATKKTE